LKCPEGTKLCVTSGVEQCIYDDEICEEGGVYATVNKAPPPVNREIKPYFFDDDEKL